MKNRGKKTLGNEYLERMIKNLPVLRAAAGLTQAQLGEKVGVSRQTIVVIENEKSPLTWSLYLAMVCVFGLYQESLELLNILDIFSADYLISDL